tara:strand:+ start:14159 stop:15181 length:1023 start_codon:yes stop_codon:yes gene_type:complete
MKILVTGAAGFIGYHLTAELLKQGNSVIGFDNMNSYYDQNLKQSRILDLNQKSLRTEGDLSLIVGDLKNKNDLDKLFSQNKIEIVINLAAQAGVRYSIECPNEYIQSNIVGFANLIENCRANNIKHLIYASSSSVYGGNKKIPFSEEDNVDHPVSLYAATKKSNELIAHTYSHLYNIPSTGLRFFTVYGPWGRPDMALFLFTKAILEREPIKIFNNGNMIRDFTYIDDITESIIRLIKKKPLPTKDFDFYHPNPSTSWAPHNIFNIGNSKPIELMDYIKAIEDELKIEAIKEYLPMQPGDVEITSADTTRLQDWIGFKPKTTISYGINKFISWYKKYYNI